MNRSATQSTWHGLLARTLENDSLRVVVVPELGGKIVSLLDRRAGREWMIGPGDRPIRPVPYGATFIEQDMSGWDEMFPTINACPYPGDGPRYRTPLPDHGEVWSLSWKEENVTSDSLTLSVRGRALPYLLSRTITLVELGQVRLDYEVVNEGDDAMPYLWAAHPQFAGEPETSILLPTEVSRVFNAVPFPQWGAPGTLYPWPEATRTDGKRQRLDRIRSAEIHECHKFYVLPDQTVRWTALVDHACGTMLRMEWAPPVVYLGVLVDEGMFNSAAVIALEPSTAFYDSLERAWQLQRASLLPPRGRHQWHIILRLEKYD